MKRIILVLLACIILATVLTACRPSPKLSETENDLGLELISLPDLN